MAFDRLKKAVMDEDIRLYPHRQQIAIKPEAISERAERAEQGNSQPITADDIIIDADAIGEKHEMQLHPDLEHIPRETVIKMIKVGLDVEFTFKVELEKGNNFVQAMRQVLSRSRKKARRKNVRLDEFKVLERSITSKPTDEPPHDEVTLVCSKNMSALELSVYDEIIEQMERK